MTQEDIELLLKDISARLPYGVICQVDDGAAGLNDGKLVEIDISKELVRFDADYYWDAYIDDIKPYLRPMSSMTEKEKEEMHNLLSPEGTAIYKNDGIAVPINHFGEFIPYEFMGRIIQYLLEHHFDFMELIQKGLAIEAPEGMYN